MEQTNNDKNDRNNSSKRTLDALTSMKQITSTAKKKASQSTIYLRHERRLHQNLMKRPNNDTRSKAIRVLSGLPGFSSLMPYECDECNDRSASSSVNKSSSKLETEAKSVNPIDSQNDFQSVPTIFTSENDPSWLGKVKLKENENIIYGERSSEVSHAFIAGFIGGMMEAVIGRTKKDIINRVQSQITSSFQIIYENRITSHWLALDGGVAAPFKIRQSLPRASYFLSNQTSTNNLPSPFYNLSENRTNGTAVFNNRIVISAASSSVLFASNTFFRSLLHIDNNGDRYGSSGAKNKVDPFSFNFCVSSALTGTVTAAIFAPFEMLRSQMVLRRTMGVADVRFGFASPMAATRATAQPFYSIRDILKESLTIFTRQGYKGCFSPLYTGGSAVFAREIFGNIAFFSTYEFAKSWFRSCWSSGKEFSEDSACQEYGQHDRNSTLSVLLAGGGAGIAYWSVALPFDNLRSFLQIQQQHSACGTVSFSSAVNRFGLKNMFRGYVPCMLRAIPANAILLLGYESVLGNFQIK